MSFTVVLRPKTFGEPICIPWVFFRHFLGKVQGFDEKNMSFIRTCL